MFKVYSKTIIIILILVKSGFAQNSFYLSLSSVKSKPLAMGGAYTAVEDDIVSTFYNPATLSLYKQNKDMRFTLYFNPIAPVTHYNTYKDELTTKQYAKIGTLLFKSLIFTGKFINMAVILNEQIIQENKLLNQKKFFSNIDLWKNCYHTLAISFKLAERVMIGTAVNLYNIEIQEKTERDVGFSYGIMLKPAPNLNVGLSYIDFPKSMQNIRLPLERMEDETMNIGISYRLTKYSTISYDLRNLTEDNRKNVRESHFGIEQKIWSLLALRGGYYQERDTKDDIYSVGIGLLDTNLFFSKENRYNHSQFTINYSFLYKEKSNSIFRWHVLSLMLRL